MRHPRLRPFAGLSPTSTPGRPAAVVTNPIAKSVLYRAGFLHPGHTEFLAELAKRDGGQRRSR